MSKYKIYIYKAEYKSQKIKKLFQIWLFFTILNNREILYPNKNLVYNSRMCVKKIIIENAYKI